jgi:hypothetical protein
MSYPGPQEIENGQETYLVMKVGELICYNASTIAKRK